MIFYVRNLSFTSYDMKKLNPKAKFIVYSEIHNLKNIDELLGKYEMAFILYLLQSETYGHWVCLFKRDGKMSYFNSYGLTPDEDFKYAKKGLRKLVHEEEPYLFELLAKSGYECEYNDYCFQGKNTSTCGRWSSHRLWNRHLNPDEYYLLIKKLCKYYKLNPDQLVTKLTKL